MRMVGSSESAKTPAVMLAAKSPSGIAVCHIRSSVRSELRPHRIIKTEAMPNGIEFRSPVCMLVRPKDLMICGCQSDRHWLPPHAPAYISDAARTYLLLITFHSES